MVYAISFRIPYTDPFGNRVYYHQSAFSKKAKNVGDMVSVQDTRTGLTSPYLGEVHNYNLTGRLEDSFRFKLAETV